MYLLGEWQVDPARRRVSRGSESARLSPKAMRVLDALRDARGRVLSRAELLDEVWPDVTVGEEVLTHAIAELRKALGDNPRVPRYIETVHKSGYRLLTDQPLITAATGLLDLENHAACLDASELFFRGGASNVRLAADRFSAILDSDPTNALAHAGLVKCLVFMHKYYGATGEASERIERCGRRAVAVDENAAETQAALGLALTASGKQDEALACFARSLKLNPHLAETHYLLGRTYFVGGDYRLAATMFERAGALRSDDFHTLLLASKARRFMGDERRCRADLIQAEQRIDDYLILNPDDRIAHCDKVCCMVELGAAKKGVEVGASLIQEPPPSNYYLVCGLARAGETDLAMDCLETVVASGWRHGAWATHDRDLDPLRQEPGFRRLASELWAP